MAIGGAMVLGVGGLVAAVVVGLMASSSSSSSSSTTSKGGPTGGDGGGGGGTGAGGLDLVTCSQAFDAIPNDPKDASGKGLKDVVLAAVASPTLTTAQAETIASGLQKLALIAPDAKTVNALNVAAQCVREHAKEVASGGGSGSSLPDAMSCDAAFGSLPADVQAQIIAARNAGTAVAKTFADTLDAMAALATDPSTKTALGVAAKCLRSGGGSATGEPGLFRDEAGNYSRAGGLPPRKGVASNPLFQWKHVVVAGDNASAITAAYFGSAGATRARVDELINNNPRDAATGRNLGPIRSDWPSGTPGQTPGVLNWTSLIAGDVLRIPKSWNQWIDETAITRRDTTPYPTVA